MIASFYGDNLDMKKDDFNKNNRTFIKESELSRIQPQKFLVFK